jgi:hypothetical protein
MYLPYRLKFKYKNKYNMAEKWILVAKTFTLGLSEKVGVWNRTPGRFVFMMERDLGLTSLSLSLFYA